MATTAGSALLRLPSRDGERRQGVQSSASLPIGPCFQGTYHYVLWEKRPDRERDEKPSRRIAAGLTDLDIKREMGKE